MEHLAKTAKVPVIVKIQRPAIKSVEAAFLVYARKVGVVPAVTQVCMIYQYYMQVFVSGNLKLIDPLIQRTFQLASLHLRKSAEIFRIEKTSIESVSEGFLTYSSKFKLSFWKRQLPTKEFLASWLHVRYRAKSESTFLKYH